VIVGVTGVGVGMTIVAVGGAAGVARKEHAAIKSATPVIIFLCMALIIAFEKFLHHCGL
jgi:hypothetical protein